MIRSTVCAVLVLVASSAGAQEEVVVRLKAVERLRTAGASIGYGELKPATPDQPAEPGGEKPVIRIELLGDKITDDVVRDVRLFPYLETLSLAGSRVTDVGLDYLKDLEKLKVLNLTYCPITDKGLTVLRGSKCKDSLEVLQLSFTRVTDAGMAAVAAMRKLKTLSVSHTRVSDAGLAEVAKLKNLNELYLDGTLITRPALDAVKDLPLEKLSYVGTRAATPGDDGFRKRPTVPPPDKTPPPDKEPKPPEAKPPGGE